MSLDYRDDSDDAVGTDKTEFTSGSDDDNGSPTEDDNEDVFAVVPDKIPLQITNMEERMLCFCEKIKHLPESVGINLLENPQEHGMDA